MRPSELKKLLISTINANLPVLITGAPGIGKTDIVEQAALEAKANIIVKHPVVDDPTNYKGMPSKNDKKNIAEFLPFGDLNELITAKKKTVCFIDDMGQATPTVQAALMQLLLKREIDGKRISDHVVFVAATNRRQDKAAVTGVLEPVKSRFATIVELTVHLDDWCDWAYTRNDVPEMVIQFIKFRPAFLHSYKPTNDIVNSSSPRTIHNVGKLLTAGIPTGLEFEVISGAAGEDFAREYLEFVKCYAELPKIADVLNKPESAKVPQSISALFAVSDALVRRSDKSNFDAVVKYARRLPKEYEVKTIKQAVKLNENLTKTLAYTQWEIDNANITLA